MCITNKMMEETLKSIRAYEAGEKDEAKMAEILANIKVISECLESVEKKIKADMKDTYSGKIYYFPSIEKKVYLSEGKSSSTVNPAGVFLNMKNEGIDGMFPDIVNIVKNKVENLPTEYQETVNKIIAVNTQTELGKPVITVMKMNKKELIENRA